MKPLWNRLRLIDSYSRVLSLRVVGSRFDLLSKFDAPPISLSLEVGVLMVDRAFNRSSPSNVIAGQGGADLSALMELYSRNNEKAQREKIERQNAGKVDTVYDDTTEGRFPSWVPYIGTKKKIKPGYNE